MNLARISNRLLSLSIRSRNGKTPPIPHTKQKNTCVFCTIKHLQKSQNIYASPTVSVEPLNPCNWCVMRDVNSLIAFSLLSDVTKKVQELYALINYGEMRRKVQLDNQKLFMKLRELVYRGSVSVRVKGKNCRIKTPSCPALRKINQVESKYTSRWLLTAASHEQPCPIVCIFRGSRRHKIADES